MMINLTPSRRQQTAAHQRIVVSAGVPVPLALKLDALASDLGTNRSRLIAAAIAEGLDVVAAKAAADQQQAK